MVRRGDGFPVSAGRDRFGWRQRVPAPRCFPASVTVGCGIAITNAVLAGLPDKLPNRAQVVELYAGLRHPDIRAFGIRARVLAYEGNADAHAALRGAIAGRRVEAIQRDLARQPLAAKELGGAVAIVLDPPFAGAAAQMPAIATSGVGRVIYVSCNPAALARDARVLRDAGYAHSARPPRLTSSCGRRRSKASASSTEPA